MSMFCAMFGHKPTKSEITGVHFNVYYGFNVVDEIRAESWCVQCGSFYQYAEIIDRSLALQYIAANEDAKAEAARRAVLDGMPGTLPVSKNK